VDLTAGWVASPRPCAIATAIPNGRANGKHPHYFSFIDHSFPIYSVSKNMALGA
jgi:hypothetical protein